MTDQQKFLAIDREVKDGIKQSDILQGQETEKINTISKEFGAETPDALLDLMEKEEINLTIKNASWQKKFDELKNAHAWETI